MKIALRSETGSYSAACTSQRRSHKIKEQMEYDQTRIQVAGLEKVDVVACVGHEWGKRAQDFGMQLN